MVQHTVLLAGELGTGLGHVMPLFRMAETLRGRAAEAGIKLRCVYAVDQPDILRHVIPKSDLAVRAPRTPSQGDLKSHTASYAEVLIVSGFAQLEDLQNGVANWDDLFALTSPSLLVADHSPTAVLAAHGKIPSLVIGNGFTVPPAEIDVYPALIAGRSAPAIQTRMLQNVDTIIRRRGGAGISALPGFLKGDARGIFTIPQLDPYGPLRDTALHGPYERATAGPVEVGSGIFLYGHTNVPSFPDLVRGSIDSGLPILAYLTGNNRELTFLLRQKGAHVFDEAPNLDDVLRKVSVVVSNGGAGLSQTALMAGRPQVILPVHMESQMLARNLSALGCAEIVAAENADILPKIIRDTERNPACLANCRKQADAIGQAYPMSPLNALAETCFQKWIE